MTEKVTRQKMVASAPAGAEQEGEAEKAAPKRITTTIAELGARLPVGLSPGGALVKDLVSRPWKTKDERELSKLRKPKMSMAAYIGVVIGHMFKRFGHHEWDAETKMETRRVHIGQAYMGDVFYAYMWLRREVIGNELALDITCPNPNCGHGFRFVGDLGSTSVNMVEDITALDWVYDLKHPIEIRKKTVARFRLRAPRWFALEGESAGEMTEANGKIMVARSSIVGLNDEPGDVAITDSEIDELSKYDLEALVNKANSEYIGPRMAVDGKCPKCERPFQSPIDWSYERFFTTSSL